MITFFDKTNNILYQKGKKKVTLDIDTFKEYESYKTNLNELDSIFGIKASKEKIIINTTQVLTWYGIA